MNSAGRFEKQWSLDRASDGVLVLVSDDLKESIMFLLLIFTGSFSQCLGAKMWIYFWKDLFAAVLSDSFAS
jgi:hypothetical protein